MPRTPPSPCSQAPAGCPNLRPCPDHPPTPWAKGSGADRRRARGINRSGSSEQARNQRILRRHDTICHVCGKPGATEVDHVIPLSEDGPDTDANLRPIHPTPCHARKSAAEAARARARKHRH